MLTLAPAYCFPWTSNYCQGFPFPHGGCREQQPEAPTIQAAATRTQGPPARLH